MNMVSKPKKRIWLDVESLGTIVRGRRAGYVGWADEAGGVSVCHDRSGGVGIERVCGEEGGRDGAV